jgi:hypothetical protein
MLSCYQFVEQPFRLFQIPRIEPFGEPAVDRSENLASLDPPAMSTPEPRHAHRGAEFPELSFRRACVGARSTACR